MSTTARRLKERTADLHARVESGLDLVDPALDVARLHAVLECFLGFWSATEPIIDRWAHENPDAAARLRWSRRRRTEQLRSDLDAVRRVLGLPGDECVPAPAVFEQVDESEVLGWLYVSEGSTLGGAVIERLIRPLTTAAGVQLDSFTPYAEGPGPMWREYLDQLEAWTSGGAGRTERVVAAGVATFGALGAWLDVTGKKIAA